jgi:hypothetical protein
MILKECLEWITAAEQLLRGRRLPRLRLAVEALGRSHGQARWQVGVSSAGLDTASVRLLVAGRKLPVAALEWSLARDEALPPGPRRKATLRPLTPEFLAEPAVAALLGDFVARCPARELVLETEKDARGRWIQSARWGLRLARPEPWARFARLTLAEPFAPRATIMAYLLSSRAVHEVRFEGPAVTVFLGA